MRGHTGVGGLWSLDPGPLYFLALILNLFVFRSKGGTLSESRPLNLESKYSKTSTGTVM